MSDLHIEFESGQYWSAIEQRARRGDAPAVELWARQQQLLATPDHPRVGPELRGLAAAKIDFLLLPGDIGLGLKFGKRRFRYPLGSFRQIESR
jgi:hypothetical protein